MRDLEMFAMLKEIIEAAEPDFGIPLVDGLPGILVAQSYQPTTQGVAARPTAYLEIVGHQRVGQPERSDYYDEDTEEEIHRETQVMVTMFQVSALVTQDAASTTQLTPGDVINLIAMILRNSQTVQQVEDLGCGLIVGKETRNPKFMDDRGRWEAGPSLDFSVTHKLIVSRVQPVLQSKELEIISI